MSIQKWFDLTLLVCMLVIGTPFVIMITIEARHPITAYEPDKTAIDTEMGLTIDEVKKTGADLLMSLVVTDDLIPFPRSIKINNTPIIDINKAWVIDKSNNIAKLYSASGQYKLSTMLDYTIKSVTYVNNNGDPYLHYVLEAN